MSLYKALEDMNVRVDGESATMFFQRELEHRKAQTYDVIRAPLRAFEQIPVDSTAGPGAESIVYEQYDMTGIAKIIANYADDLPRADVKGKEFVARVKSVGSSYGYSLQEIRNAQLAGKSLEQRKANASGRAQRETWNQVAYYGDAEHGLGGWLTNENIPSEAASTKTAGGTNWLNADGSANATTDEVLADLNAVANDIVDNTNGAEVPDTIVMPIRHYNYIASTRQDSGTDTTILQYFLNNNPYITDVMWANEFSEDQRTKFLGEEDPFTGGIMIAYERDADKLTFEMPQPFEQLPVQERNLEFVVPCHSRIAGTLVYYPLSMNIMEGI